MFFFFEIRVNFLCVDFLKFPVIRQVTFQLTFTCSKSAIEKLEKVVKYVQS